MYVSFLWVPMFGNGVLVEVDGRVFGYRFWITKVLRIPTFARLLRLQYNIYMKLLL